MLGTPPEAPRARSRWDLIRTDEANGLRGLRPAGTVRGMTHTTDYRTITRDEWKRATDRWGTPGIGTPRKTHYAVARDRAARKVK